MRDGRRLIDVLLAAAVLAAGALVAVASPAAGQTIPGADCGSATLRWLFWPKGHREITSFGGWRAYIAARDAGT